MRVAPRFAVLAMLAVAGCIGPKVSRGPALPTTAPSLSPDVRVTGERPPVAILAREGDPQGAIGIAVSTAGIEPARGAEVAVALSGLILARLQTRGIRDASVTPGWDGYRIRVLVDAAQDGPATLVDAVHAAMTTPLSADGPELPIIQRRLDALAHRPMADAALLDAVRCTGEPFAVPGDAAPPDAARIESWRRSAHVLGRVAMAAVGRASLADAVAGAVARGAAWPAALPPAGAVEHERVSDTPAVYEAVDLAPGTARATLAFHTSRPEQAVAAAETLGDRRGALATRLGALESPPRLSDVTATAGPGGGCLALTLLFSARELAGGGSSGGPERAARVMDGPSRIATAVALARQEAKTELAEVIPDGSLGRAIANRAGDPRDAAEQAAWWTLVSMTAPADAAARSGGVSIAIGLAGGREATRRPEAPRTPLAFRTSPSDPTIQAKADAIRAELDRATIAWHEPVVQARARVEAGQGELWLLLASPCGTLAEVDGDAGLGAVVALATAERAPAAVRASGVLAEGWAADDGIGVIVHGPSMPGESPAAHARRLADAAARSFAADPLDADAVARARGGLLGRASSAETTRAFSTLASVLAPGHPSWIAPLGTAEALGRSSDAAVATRASALRAGPLRVAVLANVDAGQSAAAVRAVDRWVARRPGEVRACPQAAPIGGVHAGTYSVEVAGAASSEVWLAVALPPNDAGARASATLLAGALDGPDGLLGHVLGSGFARGWSARVLGPAAAPALVVRVWSVQGALDGAVAETRALLQRIRQGSLVEADRTRAIAERATAALASELDPRSRLLALWRTAGSPGGPPPSLEALRAFAAATLLDESLVIVAARPPRDPHSTTHAETRPCRGRRQRTTRCRSQARGAPTGSPASSASRP
jgi:hypothetical protein